MSTYAVRDSLTMLRRDFRHVQRYPVMAISMVMLPTITLLLFVYVFGGAMEAAIGGAGISYIDYVVPGILMMTLGSGCAATAVGISMDMTEGITARFRVMAISRASVLTGHVLGNWIRTLLGVALVIGVSLVAGFQPTAGPLEWVAAFGVIAVLTLGLTWLAVAMGLAAKSVEGANGSTQLLQFGPFLSSAFVDPDTMPAGVGWVAANQPFSPMIETMRGLLLGTPIGNKGVIAAAWCAAIALTGYLWSRAAYERDRTRT